MPCDYEIEERVFDWDIKKYLKTVSLKNDVKLFGSSTIRNIRYFKDFDAYEKLIYSYPDRQMAVKTFMTNLRAVIARVLLTDLIIFSELKCGYDVTYENLYRMVKRRKKTNAIAELKRLEKAKILTTNQSESLRRVIKQNQGMVRLEKIVKRDYYTLRWTSVEFLSLRKRMRNKKYITLEEAINQNTLVKMDLIIPVRFVYKELSVIYDVSHIDSQGQPIQITETMKNNYYVAGIVQDIRYYLMDNLPKANKRLYFLTKHLIEQNKNDMVACSVIRSIEKVFASDCSSLDRILDELQIMKEIICIIRKYKGKNQSERKKSHIKNIVFQILGYYSRINDSFDDLDTKNFTLKNQVTMKTMSIGTHIFNEAIKINPDGSLVYRKSEQVFFRILNQSVIQMIELLEPLVDSLYVLRMKENGLTKTSIHKYITTIVS